MQNIIRPRRLRRTAPLRRMVRETQLQAADFIYPLFVTHGTDLRRPITSMPGQFNLSLDQLAREAEELEDLGIPAVILFGLPQTKDTAASEAFAEDGIVQEAIRTLKAVAPELVVITDVCVCEYMSHGHCGIINEQGYVMNSPTLNLLQAVALSHAKAGADIVAPSGMMDGVVNNLRGVLDRAGMKYVGIMAYAVKYASAFYGPFREAADSAPAFGDRKQYQMDPANIREALREAELDVAQAADILMVKPALPYLDVLAAVRREFNLPTAAYHVSGEYAMIKAAAQNGWINERAVALESLLSIKRAGADMILTYYAKEAARWLRDEE